MNKLANSPQIRLQKHSPAYWRVTFDHPPLNIFGATSANSAPNPRTPVRSACEPVGRRRANACGHGELLKVIADREGADRSA